ncbi:MAG: hypothetical protein HY722_02375 [Planctomycetes bacterium]|nr:hypothetical protein [Planctomycetota bacterium]
MKRAAATTLGQDPLLEERPFWGREFLTWLLHKCDENSGAFDLADLGTVGVYFDRALLLAPPEEKGQHDFFRGGNPSASHELGAALMTGKKVARAYLSLARGQRVFNLTLTDRYDLVSLEVPRDGLLAEDALERFQEAFGMVEEALRVLDELYGRFVQARLADAWVERESPRLKAWIRTRGQEVCHH